VSTGIWKRQAAACRKLVVACAWCTNPAAEPPPSGQVTHGICQACFEELKEKAGRIPAVAAR